MFGFVKVGHVAVQVYAARKVASSGPVPVAPRHETKQDVPTVDVGIFEFEEAKHERQREPVGGRQKLLLDVLVPIKAIVGSFVRMAWSLSLQPARDVPAAIREVERGGKEVRLEQSEQVTFLRMPEQS